MGAELARPPLNLPMFIQEVRLTLLPYSFTVPSALPTT